jgi:uncharacterized membrane protein
MEKLDSKKLVPRAGAAYGHGWRMLWKYFITLLLVSLIMVVAAIPFIIPANLSDFDDNYFNFMAIAVVFGQIFAIAYALFVISPLEYGIKWIYLQTVRDRKAEVVEVFDSFKNYLNVVLASLLTGAIIAFGFFMVIIPGIIFACRLAFVPYLVMDKKYDPVKAVEESWRLTKGHGWRIFWMGIIAFFVIILGLICLGFGVFISFMWISSAFASIYQAVLEEKGELVDVPAES